MNLLSEKSPEPRCYLVPACSLPLTEAVLSPSETGAGSAGLPVNTLLWLGADLSFHSLFIHLPSVYEMSIKCQVLLQVPRIQQLDVPAFGWVSFGGEGDNEPNCK